MSDGKKGLSTGIKVLIGIIVVVLLIGGIVIGRYNNLVSLEERVNTQFSNISTQLQRRNDLIPNLVNTVQAYAKHEEEIFTAVAEARSSIMGAATEDETAAADRAMTQALTRLIAVAESYPELRASDNYRDLQNQLAGTENRIAVARKDYNDAVKEYNAAIRRFPGNILGNMFGFKSHEFFQITEGADQVPDVTKGNTILNVAQKTWEEMNNE